MITTTSITHPTTKSAIRTAAFNAAITLCESHDDHGKLISLRGTDYAQRVDRSLFMRVDVEQGGNMRFYGALQTRIDSKVFKALGRDSFIYLENLCAALATPATDKIWS